jgi:dolichyl-phosphate beta-glucosyltransferase
VRPTTGEFVAVTEIPSPFLTIVIPAYNEERRLPPTLHKIALYLREQAYTTEVLVVENGSADRTSEVVQDFIASDVRPDDNFRVQLLHSEPGKGIAVKTGMLAGHGDYLFICDADLAMPISEIGKFFPPALPAHSYDIAIASREAPGAVRYDEPFYRHFMGRVFNSLVRVMAVPGIQDTQCGFKCFTREAAQIVFPLQQISGWGFDVEVLYAANKRGLKLAEVPIHWYYQSDSRVRPVHDTISMVRELMHIRRMGAAGVYDGASPASGADLPTATGNP